MKQMIGCPKCATRPVPSYPCEWYKRVLGTAKEDMKCDFCVPATPIPKGSECCADSMGRDSQPYYPWEAAFIEPGAQVPQVVAKNPTKEETATAINTKLEEMNRRLREAFLFRAGRKGGKSFGRY